MAKDSAQNTLSIVNVTTLFVTTTMESRSRTLDRFGFIISPRPPYVPDVLLCSVDTHSPLVSVVGALSSDVTQVSARNLSRWLFLLACHFSRARPIRPPAVYRPITVVGADVFVRCLDEIGPETFSCDSSDPLPPGCYALFDLDGNPYPYPIGCTVPRPTFALTEPAWDVPDNHHHAAYRMGVCISPRFPTCTPRFTRNLSPRSSPTRPASATAGCAVSLAVPLAASPGSFHHFFPVLLPDPPFRSSSASPLTMSSQFRPTSSKRITTTVLPSIHRMDTASLSSKNFQTFLCWIAWVRRLRPAASGALACVGHWLSASLVAMPVLTASSLWRLGSFSTSLPTKTT
ncbi:hypothetical protein FB451DRAFT_1264516 [Mycena latifolia]|nr:hypothetical protein FB451DRAFT_1264516 [Mycena latifolia]